MRVAIVCENFLPKIDGVTRTLARLLEHLREHGHAAIVFGPQTDVTTYAGFEVVGTYGVPLVGLYGDIKGNFFRPEFARRLCAFRPDVVLFADPTWLGPQCIAAFRLCCPRVAFAASFHTNVATYTKLFGMPWLSTPTWDAQRYFHSICDVTFCPSPSTARMLDSRGFRNVALWPRGVDTELFHPSRRDYELRAAWGASAGSLPTPAPSYESLSSISSSSPPPSYSTATTFRGRVVILYVGRLSWEKNLRLLVEAFRGLECPTPCRPACQLVFVGDGPARRDLEDLCESYELDAVFTGFRAGRDLAAAYASADIFAFPSWTETFGQVASEALASGLPVVGLNAEGVCDLVQHGETGLLLNTGLPGTSLHDVFAPGSASFNDAVAVYRRHLVELVTDHAMRASMGRLAAERSIKRSWHNAMEMLLSRMALISPNRRSSLDIVCGSALLALRILPAAILLVFVVLLTRARAVLSA